MKDVNYDCWISEPILHSHVEDGLPEDHPLAFKTVYCNRCGDMTHAENNECMTAWAETDGPPLCLRCLSEVLP